MNILHFPKKFLQYFICCPCFYATAQKLRQLDYVILLNGTNLGMKLKDLISILFSCW